ncbi:MAG: hypothetical protein JF606_19295, partial [Burkholderiales bacterium]|nr:hypothetical protein [Burkholderiales bacterium]
MENINSIGKRKAGSTSAPPEEPSAAPQARPASFALVAPEALRRRTDAGHVAGQGGVDFAPRQGTLPPRGAHVPSMGSSAGALPVANSTRHPAAVLNQYVSDVQELIPLIHEVKARLATVAGISKRPGMSKSFSNAFNADGTLKPPADNRNARSLHNKLEFIQQSHPTVVEKFKLATGRQQALRTIPCSESNEFAGDLQKLIPLIHEVKDGRATPLAISRRPGMSGSFANAFAPDGTLKPASPNAKSILKKLEAIRQSHRHVADAFQAAMDRRKLKPGEAPAHRAASLDINDFGARRHEPARLILQIRQHAVSLEDAEPGFPGLSRLIDSSGLWHSEPELGLVCGELVAPQEQENFFPRIQEIDQLLLPGALARGESSVSAAQAVPADLPGPGPGPAAAARLTFDLNIEPDLADAPQSPALSPVPDPRPVKLEPIDRAPAVRVPLLVETPLDQARTAFYEEFEVCNLTGDAPKWTSTLAKTGGVIVHHRMEPVPGNDDKFPLRDLNNPARAHPRYAGDDGKCHRNVALKTIKLDDKEGAHEFLQELCASDPRLPLNRRQLKTALKALTADAKEEFERLIEERPHTNPRCQPRQLSAADVQDHEQVLIGQY